MEGFLLAVHVSESGGKRPWQTDFVKFDDISAQLLGFTDRSLAEIKWKLHLKDADVATPVPGDRKHDHAPNVDETPHCFYAHEVTSCGHEVLVFLAAPDDDTKKKWMKCLLQAAKDGPHPPIFTGALSPRAAAAGSCPNPLPPFWFEARVTQVRLHSDGKHAEYMVTCHVSLFSRVADRRLNKEWNVWHRFSEFDQLNEALKLSLGAEKMADVPFHKTQRDAIRSLFGWWSLDQDFLDHRRLLLDTFVTRVCAIEGATEFFQDHSEQHLKKFLEFDEHCEDLDHSPRKHSPTKAPRKDSSDKHSSSGQQDASPEPPRRDSHAMLRTSDMSPRDSDHESASFSSAIMSPIAAATPTKPVEVAAPPVPVPAPAPPSPTDKKKKNKKAVAQDAPALQVEVAVAPVVDDPSATTKPAAGGLPCRNSRKKGKGKEAAQQGPVEKESCAAAVATSEAVRGAAPTSGKKGTNKRN